MDVASSKKAEKRKIKKAEKKLIADKIVGAATPTLKNLAKPKKKDSGFTKFLKGALGVATDLVPALLPFMLGSHAQGKQLMAAAGPQAAGVPVATGQVCGNLCGLKAIRTVSKDPRGNLMTIVVSTMDYLQAIPVPQSDVVAGDILAEMWVNPLDPSFAGTKFAEYGNLNERWRIKRAAFVYEATTPSTAPGALTMCVFDDPLVSLDNEGGDEVLRAVASQSGADTFQIWEAGCAQVPTCKDLLYTEPDNTDVRLSVAGKFMLVAASAMDVSTIQALGAMSLGNLYFISETEYSIPSVADQSNPGDCLSAYDSSLTVFTANQPLAFPGASVYPALGGSGKYLATATFSYSGSPFTGTAVSGLSPGNYFCLLSINGTGISAGAEPSTTDEADSYGVESTTVHGTLTSTVGVAYCQFQVPVGIPEELPVICFVMGAATSLTEGSFFLAMVNPNGVSFDTPVPKLALPRRVPGVPARDKKENVWKRQQFYAKTIQGKAEAQDLLMHYLVQKVTNASTPPSPLTAPCSYQSFSDLLPKISTSPVTVTSAAALAARPAQCRK